VTWFKDGKELKKNDHYSINYSHGVCSLEVSQSEVADTGIYRCLAVNDLGDFETSSKVIVEGMCIVIIGDIKSDVCFPVL
jgi:hypothetical protein